MKDKQFIMHIVQQHLYADQPLIDTVNVHLYKHITWIISLANQWSRYTSPCTSDNSMSKQKVPQPQKAIYRLILIHPEIRRNSRSNSLSLPFFVNCIKFSIAYTITTLSLYLSPGPVASCGVYISIVCCPQIVRARVCVCELFFVEYIIYRVYFIPVEHKTLDLEGILSALSSPAGLCSGSNDMYPLPFPDIALPDSTGVCTWIMWNK